MNSSPPRRAIVCSASTRASVSLDRRHALQALGDPDEQLVADDMAQTVVHQLEAIEIQEQDGVQAVRPSAAPCQRSAQAVEEQHAIGQAGQRIGHLAQRDVGHRAGHAIAAIVAVPDRQAARQHPAIAAVLVAARRCSFSNCGVCPATMALDRFPQRRHVVLGARDRASRPGCADRSLLVQPEHQLPTRRDVERASPQVPVPDAVVRATNGERVALLAVP